MYEAFTTSGPVGGIRAEGVLEFRGIPFAGPIGGAARFRAATPPPPWTTTYPAVTWPRMAPQPWGDMSRELATYHGLLFGEPYETSATEDGLYLNLWTPAADDARRPVMVWLHGGGFFFGQPTRRRENGRMLSAAEDVVVVAPSHRLGLLGYLDTRETLGGDANVGLRDIILALHWVRDNIAAFGGDPDNVTIFGESGGGMKVAALLAVPSAAGLFHKAVCQSHVMPLPGVPGGLGTRASRAVLDAVLDVVGDPRTLLDRPAAELALIAPPAHLGWQPVLDDETLPIPVADALAAGASAEVPLLLGTNADEARVLHHGRMPSTTAELAGVLPAPAPVVRHYVGDAPAGTGLFHRAAERALTDGEVRIPAIGFAGLKASAGAASVFMYVLRWRNPARPDIGAGHGVETPMVFGTVDAVPALRDEPSAYVLSAGMRAAWAAFARDGVPTVGGLPWPAYTVSRRDTVIWDVPPSVESDPGGDDRRAWS